MVCRNCGSKLYEGDRFCSRCGTRVTVEVKAESETAAEGVKAETEPITEEVKPASETAAEAVEETKPESTKAETVKTEPVSAAAEGEAVKVEERKPAEPERVPPLSIPEEKPPKEKKRSKKKHAHKETSGTKKKKWLPGVILVVLGLAVVLLLVNSAKLVNFYHRNFTAPEEYYRWVEKKSIQENAKTISEYYINYFVEYLHGYDRHVSGRVSLELGDAGKDMLDLAGLAGADLSWFEKGAVTFETTNKDNVIQSIWGLEIGGELLLSMDTILDFEDEAAYVGFPELSKTYLAADTEQSGFSEGFSYVSGKEPGEYLETLELLEALYRECPDKTQVETLANKYLELLLNGIDDVNMKTGKTVRVESITQNCTALEVSLDKQDIQNMLAEFLEELQQDGEVEELLIQLYDLAEELGVSGGDYRNADEFYEAFQDRIDDVLDDMDYYITYHNELQMTVYVDNKGRIIGRTMEFPNSWDEITISYVNPRRGSRFGFQGSIIADGEEVSIVGSGKDFANKINGDFTVKYEGTGIVNIAVKDFDMKALKKGYINGNFTLTAASGIGRALSMTSAYSYLEDMTLEIAVSMEKSAHRLSMELKEGEDLWGALEVTVNRGNGRKIAVPTTKSSIFIENARDFEDWWETIKWNDFLKKMNKAGLPSEALDAAEKLSEMDVDEVLDELSDIMWLLMDELYW